MFFRDASLGDTLKHGVSMTAGPTLFIDKARIRCNTMANGQAKPIRRILCRTA